MNVFNWTGPQFLAFYFIFAGIIVLFVRYRAPRGHKDRSPNIDLGDPYLIAYLRGGAAEAVRIATLALIDRDLLDLHPGPEVETRAGVDPNIVRRPLERAILKACKSRQSPEQLMANEDFAIVAKLESGDVLERDGLLLSPAGQKQQQNFLFLIAALLGGVALIKMAIAVSHGRTNVEYLFMMCVIAIFLVFKFGKRTRTRAGEQVLISAKEIYNGLKHRAHTLRAGADPDSAALLAATFGIAALPVYAYAESQALFKKSVTGGSSSSGCGSSCGSSCGGGGCGGGCGGCGG